MAENNLNPNKDINTIKDWKGNLLSADPRSSDFGKNVKFFSTEDRVMPSKVFPKSASKLNENIYKTNPSNFSPYSDMDIYNIFNDHSMSYFKHGITIDRQSLNTSPGNLFSTPEENNDPVIFGFELIIDAINSPLLNGSIDDFLNKFSEISEIKSKIPVYEDFKKQFIKLFKTNATVNINENGGFLLNQLGKSNINQIANSSDVGKRAYMSYYLQKVGGLDKLSENNDVSSAFKYTADYKKDAIVLTFIEDVSLTLGTLASLYKLLYWSKPNGKSLIPENLLRFNCKIIVSELRNFTRVKASGNSVEVIKDNLSRYVYDIKECQFFFSKLPHGDIVDNTKTDTFLEHSVSFDYKYSTVTFERFNPNINKYAGYNSGGMWDSNGNEFVHSTKDLEIREFLIKNYTNFNIVDENPNSFNDAVESEKQNSIRNISEELRERDRLEAEEMALRRYFIKNDTQERMRDEELAFTKAKSDSIKQKKLSDVLGTAKFSYQDIAEMEGGKLEELVNPPVKKQEKLKDIVEKNTTIEKKGPGNTQKIKDILRKKTTLKGSINRAGGIIKQQAKIAGRRYLQEVVNKNTALLNKSLNKALNAIAGTRGIKPPLNVYTDKKPSQASRFFYDVRGQLADFAGDALKNILGG